jgi:membrane protein
MGWRTIWRLLQETVTEWNNDKAEKMAAALAYYTIFSLAPLLIIVVAIAGTFFDEGAARTAIIEQIQGLVGQDGAEVVQTALEYADRPGWNQGEIASLIGLALLLFGASGVFVQLQEALNIIWNVVPKPGRGIWNFLRKRVLSFGVIISIGFLLLVSLVVSTFIAGANAFARSVLPGFDFLWQVLNIFISFGVITFLFALIYKYIPDVRITWKDVWIGAAITALLFTIGKTAIGLYLGNSGFGSTYGAAGSLVVFLAWIYYSAQILFFGAEFTQVYARRYGSHILPAKHAVPETDSLSSKKQDYRR